MNFAPFTPVDPFFMVDMIMSLLMDNHRDVKSEKKVDPTKKHHHRKTKGWIKQPDGSWYACS